MPVSVNEDPPQVAARLELAQREAQAGGELRYALLNLGAKPLATGMDYSLELLELGTWREVQTPPAVPLIGYGFNPGERRELTTRIPDESAVGHYRLRKRVEVWTDLGPWNDWGRQKFEPLELTAEFDLVAA